MAKTEVIRGKDGLRGVIVEDLNSAGELRIRLDNGTEILVSEKSLVQQKDGSYYLPMSMADLEGVDRPIGESREKIVVPVVAEELQVEKQTVENQVRVKKVVHEHEEIIDEPLLREDVDVRVVPVNKVINGPVPVREEGDTTIIPVFEEVLVVEKRLVLKEEIHVTKRRDVEHQPQKFTLREETVIIERDPKDKPADSAKSRR
jgi:stress response protein YsnF